MKNIFKFTLSILFLCNTSVANDLQQLNNKLLQIEAKFDKCLNSKDKKICETVLLENPILEVLGNDNFVKILSSSDCATGTECASNNLRVLSKNAKASTIMLDIK